MIDPAEMAERHGRILAELAELGLGFARDAGRDAAQAETPEERARAALVFQRVSRSVRQCLALEAKLARQAGREAQEQARDEAERAHGRRAARRQQLRGAVDRLVWHETEVMDGEEEDAFDAEIEAAVDAELDADAGLDGPLADQVARVIARLGFEIAENGRARRAAAPPAGGGDFHDSA